MTRSLLVAIALAAASLQARAGDLLVSSILSDEVLRYDSSTGVFISALVGVGSGGLDGPQGLAVGTDGVLYVAAEYSHSIHKYNATTGASLGTLATGLAAPNDITFGPGGLLYYTDHGSDRVRRYDTAAGIELAPIMLSDGTHHSHGITVGPDGMIYMGILDSGPGRIRRLNPVTLTDMGAFITIPGFIGIFDIAFLPDGSRVGNNTFAGAIYRFNGISCAPMPPLAAPGTITSPFGMAMGPDGLLYVCSGGLGVQRYDPVTGVSLGGFISGGAGEGRSPFAPAWSTVPTPPSVIVLIAAAGVVSRRNRRSPDRSFSTHGRDASATVLSAR